MSVVAQLEALPASGLTVSVLNALDTVVPGEWSNTNDFDALIVEVTGIDKPAVVARIRQRALQLEASEARYAQAVQVFGLADTVDQVAAGAAVANKVGGLLGGMGMSFLQDLTPKPETTQSIDAGLKLVAELVGFGLTNGVPTASADGLARFAGALTDYARFDLIRIAAWVTFDGLIPLGPNFIGIIGDNIRTAASGTLTDNAVFDHLASRLPGDTTAAKRAFVLDAIDTTGDWVSRFVEEKGLTQTGALSSLKGVMGLAEGGGDYVAAAIDASTAYMTHTGTQTVARSLARQAYEQLREDVWNDWVHSA